MKKKDLFELAFDERGPVAFTRAELADVEDLWDQRAALFFTPTSEIPDRLVGSGLLRIALPIVTPTFQEWDHIPAYRNTRLWVDLLQRATGKLRWTPINPVTITTVRRDVGRPSHGVFTGGKALTDAYKVSSTGRRDGRRVHYFGALLDDSPMNIRREIFRCMQVSKVADAGLDIEIRPWNADDGRGATEILLNGATATILGELES